MMVLRRKGLVGNLVLVLLALGVALVGSESALIAAPPELFSPAGSEPAVDGAAGRGVVRSRFVEVSFAPFSAAEVDSLILNLFDDVVLTAEAERVTSQPGGGLAWSGHVAGVDLSQVTLVVRDGVLAGNVSLPGVFYQVRPAGNGVHVVREIDQSAFPPEMEPVSVDLPQPAAAAAPGAELTDDGSIIEVLVVYTPAAAAASANILAEIDLAVHETNNSYANSNINQRLRLVHAAQVSYVQSGDISIDLNRLRNTTDGYMDEVHTLRNTYAADEVALIVYYPSSSYCGIAYMMADVSPYFESWAFAVVDLDCATGYYSFGHELGHNMGARHDWYMDNGAAPYGHAHGYVDYSNSGDRWRTIMAYNNECADQGIYCYRIPYWSNPSVWRNGAPMGVPEGTSVSCFTGVPHPYCDADNRKTLDKTAYTVANFRASVAQPPAAPSSLTATAISPARIDLAWSDNSTTETGFQIDRAFFGSGAWSPIATVGANVQSYANTSGLVSGTSYDYRVRAYNAYGNSAYSNVATATTLAEVGPVVAVGYVVDDDNVGGSSGNGDGQIDCGETIQLYVDLENEGSGLADNVQANLGTSSPYITWVDANSYYGDIAGRAVARNTDAFDFQVAAGTPHGHLIQFNLDVTALNGGSWPDSFIARVRCGGPVFISYLPLSTRSYAVGFDSQFTGSAAGWQAHSGSWWIDSGAWYRSDGVPGAWASASYASGYAEFDYEARLWRQGCVDCTHGLLVRGSPHPLGSQNTWDSGYGFYITRSGQYAIYDYNGGIGTALQPWTFSSAINQGDVWNELRVVASGSKLSFYINDGLVWVGNNDAHASGRVGVAIYRDLTSSNNKLWVDWATLATEAPDADPREVSPEQQALNEAAWQDAARGSDRRAPAR